MKRTHLPRSSRHADVRRSARHEARYTRNAFPRLARGVMGRRARGRYGWELPTGTTSFCAPLYSNASECYSLISRLLSTHHLRLSGTPRRYNTGAEVRLLVLSEQWLTRVARPPARKRSLANLTSNVWY